MSKVYDYVLCNTFLTFLEFKKTHFDLDVDMIQNVGDMQAITEVTGCKDLIYIHSVEGWPLGYSKGEIEEMHTALNVLSRYRQVYILGYNSQFKRYS